MISLSRILGRFAAIVWFSAIPWLALSAILLVKANDIVNDPTRNVVYISVADDSPLHPNTVLKVIPATAAIVGVMPVPTEPTVLAISDSSNTLLATLHATGEVLRVDLANFQQAGSFFVGTFAGHPYTALDIDFAPGSETRILIFRDSLTTSGAPTLGIYNNWEPMPNAFSQDGRFKFSDDPNVIYGQEGSDLYRVTTDQNGILTHTRIRNILDGDYRHFELLGQFMYMDSGRVVRGNTFEWMGTFAVPATSPVSVAIDEFNGTAVFCQNGFNRRILRFFDIAHYRFIDEIGIPGTSDATNMIRCGPSGCAITTEDAEVYFLQTSLAWSANWFPPNNINIVRGNVTQGGLESIVKHDSENLVVSPGVTLSSSQRPVEFVVIGELDRPVVSGLSLSIEGQASAVTVSREVEFFNYASNIYELVDTRQCTTTEATARVEIFENASRFIHPTTFQVKARIRCRAIGPVLLFPWRSTMNHVYWAAGR